MLKTTFATALAAARAPQKAPLDSYDDFGLWYHLLTAEEKDKVARLLPQLAPHHLVSVPQDALDQILASNIPAVSRFYLPSGPDGRLGYVRSYPLRRTARFSTEKSVDDVTFYHETTHVALLISYTLNVELLGRTVPATASLALTRDGATALFDAFHAS